MSVLRRCERSTLTVSDLGCTCAARRLGCLGSVLGRGCRSRNIVEVLRYSEQKIDEAYIEDLGSTNPRNVDGPEKGYAMWLLLLPSSRLR
jgi:hypothetical protein